MDIYLGIDKHDIDKFKFIAKELADKIEKENIANIKRIEEYEKEKKSLCLLFSNRIKYIENISKDILCDVINITDNLSSSYIITVLKYVKDIYYSKAEINMLMDRLINRIRIIENKEKVKT